MKAELTDLFWKLLICSLFSWVAIGWWTPYLPSVPHRAGHVRILLNVPRYAHMGEMSRIFKSPLKFSRIILYFHFYKDFIFRVFINIVFVNIALQMKCLIYVCCMCFVPQKFTLNSLFNLQDSRQQETKTFERVWLIVGKRFSNRTWFTKRTCFLWPPMPKSYIL